MRAMAMSLALLGAIGLPAAAPAASTQVGRRLAQSTPEQRAAVQTEFMATRLRLTADQRTRVEAINLSYAKKMQPILSGSEGPLRKRQEAERLQEKKDVELGQVLTGAQYRDYLAAKDELRARLKAALTAQKTPAP
jgi:hypothetical protein